MNRLLFVCLLPLCATGLAASPSDDEAWIESYMGKSGQSAAPARIQRGYRIAWGELPRFVGRSVAIQTQRGPLHHGVIERVAGNRLYLRSRLHGGYAEMVLRPDQILSTELE